MALQTIFSNHLNPELPNLSNRFIDAVGFFIVAPFLGAGIELEIDVFLQVYFPYGGGEIILNLPLGKIEEQAILLNFTDTETLNIIPSEFLHCGLEMALLFLATDTTYLEVIVIKPEISLQTLSQKIDTIMGLYSNFSHSISTSLVFKYIYAISVTPALILSANNDRKGLTIENTSDNGDLYIGFNNDISLSDYFVKILPGFSYSFDSLYSGQIWALASEANTQIKVTEFGSNSAVND